MIVLTDVEAARKCVGRDLVIYRYSQSPFLARGLRVDGDDLIVMLESDQEEALQIDARQPWQIVIDDDERQATLLEQTRAQCERAQAELALMRSKFPTRALLGELVADLIHEIGRLAANPCPTLGHECSVAGLQGAIVSEVIEAAREQDGSPKAQAEAMDIVAAALHHAMLQGVEIDHGLAAVAAKLKRRNDAVARGATWEDAKAEEREPRSWEPHGAGWARVWYDGGWRTVWVFDRRQRWGVMGYSRMVWVDPKSASMFPVAGHKWRPCEAQEQGPPG